MRLLRIAQQERSLVTDMIGQYFYFLSGIVQHIKEAQSHSHGSGLLVSVNQFAYFDNKIRGSNGVF